MGFDGSNKGSVGYGRDIKYHAFTSPETELIKQKALATASPEALRYLDPLNYKGPQIVVDSASLTEQEWQDIRKNTIGSSAVSNIFGESPYPGCTNIDLYNQKVGIAPLIQESQDEKDKKERLFLYGHIMEDYLQLYVKQKYPDCELIIDTNIYVSPSRPYLSVNLDAMLKHPDGSYSHVEFKTASPMSKQDYDNGAIPPHYKRQLIQSQHIMGVWKSILIVAFGRDDNDIITRHYERDLETEYEQVMEAEYFWKYNVLQRVEPKPLGPGLNLVKTFYRYGGYSNQTIPCVDLPQTLLADVTELSAIEDEIEVLKKKLSICENLRAAKMVPVIRHLGRATAGKIKGSTFVYDITYKPNAGRKKCDTEKLKNSYPDAYRSCVQEAKTEVSRTFKIKKGVI